MKLSYIVKPLVIILIIFASIFAYVGYNELEVLKKAKIATAKAQIANFDNAIRNYFTDTNEYPKSLNDLTNPPFPGSTSYLLDMDEVLRDPWRNPYIYHCPSIIGDFPYDIISYGADGRPGGTKHKADLTNHQLK